MNRFMRFIRILFVFTGLVLMQGSVVAMQAKRVPKRDRGGAVVVSEPEPAPEAVAAPVDHSREDSDSLGSNFTRNTARRGRRKGKQKQRRTVPAQDDAAVDSSLGAPVSGGAASGSMVGFEPVGGASHFQMPAMPRFFETTAEANLAKILADSAAPNELTQKIAKTWVRNAAGYIFSDDLRAFLEIVVNACDATVEAAGRPELVVGKFGMGFYSIFSLLDHAETNGAQIILQTAYRTSSGEIAGYTLTFSKSPTQEIAINFQEMVIPPTRIGTTIEIRPNVGNFSDATLTALRRYVHYLEFYPHVRTELATQMSGRITNELVGGPTTAYSIDVMLAPDCLRVHDRGIGISQDCAFSTLLVPSSSSKRRSDLDALRTMALAQQAQPLALMQWHGKGDAHVSHFIITVNGVIVLDKELVRPLKNSTGLCFDLVLPMPQATQLTLARDELAITQDGKSFEEAMLKKIIDQTLNDAFAGMSDMMVLTALYNGLQQWEERSAASHIKGVFTGYFKNKLNALLQLPQFVAVPAQHIHYIVPIIELFADRATPYTFLPLPEELVNYNFNKLEKILIAGVRSRLAAGENHPVLAQGLNGEIISGKHLIFVPDDLLPKTVKGKSIVTVLGLSTVLFVPCSILDKHCSPGSSLGVEKGAATSAAASSVAAMQTRSVTELIASDICSQYSHQPITTPQLAPIKTNMIFRIVAPTVVSASATEVAGGVVFDVPAQYPIAQTVYESLDKKENRLAAERLCFENLYLYKLAYADFKLEDKGKDYCGYPFFNRCFIALLGQHGVCLFKLHEQFKLLKKLKKSLGVYMLVPGVVQDIIRSERPELAATVNQDNCLVSVAYQPIYEHLCQRLLHSQYNDGRLFTIEDDGRVVNLWPLPGGASQTDINNVAHRLMDNLKAQFRHVYTPHCYEISELAHLSAPQKNKMFGPNGKRLCNRFYTRGFFPEPILIPRIPPSRLQDVVGEKLSYDVDSPESAVHVMQELKKMLRHTDNYTHSLAGKIENLNMRKVVLPLVFLLNLAKPSGYIFESLSQLFEALFGLYDNYYSIKSEDLVFVYGSYDQYDAISSIDDVLPQAVYQCVSDLAVKNRALFEKLLAFTLDDHVFQTSEEQRRNGLDSKKLYQPSLVVNTPLSLITRVAAEINFEIAMALLGAARSAEEVVLGSYVLLNPAIMPLLKSSAIELVQLQKMRVAVDYLVSDYIREKIDKEIVQALLVALRPQSKIEERISHVGQQPFMRGIVEYFTAISVGGNDFVDQTEYYNALMKASHAVGVSCGLTQLLKVHCTGAGIADPLHAGHLGEVARLVSVQPAGFASDKIMQAVEAGSERSSADAAIIECVQNSIDAIKQMGRNLSAPILRDGVDRPPQDEQGVEVAQVARSLSVGDDSAPLVLRSNEVASRRIGAAFAHRQANVELSPEQQQKLLTQIDVSVGYVPAASDDSSLVVIPGEDPGSSTQSHLVLSITDRVGLPSLKTLLTDMMVPDYSTKSPAAGSVGVMGNGMFQLYKAAAQVCIVTRIVEDPSKVYRLIVTPQRNAQGFVFDLSLNCSDVSALPFMQRFYGTSINIVFKPEAHESRNVFNYLAIKNFLRNSAGSVNACAQFGVESKPVEINYVPVPELDLQARVGGTVEHLNPPPTDADMLYELCDATGNPLIRVYKRANDLLQSYVTTGGVPFLPLSTLAKEMKLLPPQFIQSMASGIIVDIAPQMYHPVQSRTHLKMEAQAVQQLRRALLDGFYYYTLDCGVRDVTVLNRSFTHFESTCALLSVLDLSLDEYNKIEAALFEFIMSGDATKGITQENFCTYYKPSSGCKSFFEHIHENIQHLNASLNVVKQDIAAVLAGEKAAMLARLADGSDATTERATYEQFRMGLKQEAVQRVTELSRSWQNRMSVLALPIVDHVVIPWINKKTDPQAWVSLNVEAFFIPLQTQMPQLMNPSEKEASVEGQKIYDELVKKNKASLNLILNLFFKTYCQVFAGLIAKPGLIKKIKFVTKVPFTACYYVDLQKICINLDYFDIHDLLELIEKISFGQLEGLSRDTTFNYFFGTQLGNIGCIVHELEHARRGSSTNMHGPGEDADGNDGVNFDACAASYARQAIDGGLRLDWCSEFKKIFATSIISDNCCLTIRSKIEKLGKINRQLLNTIFE
jgi:hypothetical protein